MNEVFSDVMGVEPNVLLGPGFLGGWRRLRGLRETFQINHDEIASGDPFGTLGQAAASLGDRVLAGFIAYEAALATEPGLDLPDPPDLDGRRLPAMWAGIFDEAVPADPPQAKGADPPRPAVEPSEDAQAYEAKVAEVIARILAGDLFQANLSRRLSAVWPEPPSAEALMARLTAGTDAPYAALIDLPDGAIVSGSPELFLSIMGQHVAAEPIKGTRPRGADPAADEALAADLVASAKDRAENVMIADLLRNDLSKVAIDGSVREAAICVHRRLPRVHHLYSRIEARLRDGVGPFDALASAFPCGSITGAPKVAAMRTIAALEGEGRGPYCGTVFAVQGDRAVFSVAIRTGVLLRGPSGARLDVRIGGGVTALSDPKAEYEETADKAYPFELMTGRSSGLDR